VDLGFADLKNHHKDISMNSFHPIPARSSRRFQVFLICLLLPAIMTGCVLLNHDKTPNVVEIIYTAESGSIQPELQWFERYTIFRNTAMSSVMFDRTGKMNRTQVNQGGWVLKPDLQAHDKLFASLDALDQHTIQPVEPQEIPDGAGTERYELKYSDGSTFSLDYTPGMKYINGDLVTGPVQEFIESLPMPDDAKARFTFDE